MSEYPAFPKIPRFNRAAVITEKIDGTNGQISIERETLGASLKREDNGEPIVSVVIDETDLNEAGFPLYEYIVKAGSRNRWLTLGSDNYGFAKWVRENAAELVKLGPGSHFGEWWGSGIQRRYGLDEKRFSLFNVMRWTNAKELVRSGEDLWPLALQVNVPTEMVSVVPVLEIIQPQDMPNLGQFVGSVVDQLRTMGSFAAPDFKQPEGLVIFHTASRQLYKVTLENDSAPKSQRSERSSGVKASELVPNAA